jgi:hypothetical protein
VSCQALQSADPDAQTATYWIRPEGQDDSELEPFRAFCDMTFEGGGWTLIMSSNGIGPQDQTRADGDLVVEPQTGRYMTYERVLALAAAATQVHIRSGGPGGADTSITSVPGELPIQNLREGLCLNANSGMYSADDPVNGWVGPYADSARLWHSCSVPPYAETAPAYPSIWWTCNNTQGLHLIGPHSRWAYDPPENEDLEVYVR